MPPGISAEHCDATVELERTPRGRPVRPVLTPEGSTSRTARPRALPPEPLGAAWFGWLAEAGRISRERREPLASVLVRFQTVEKVAHRGLTIALVPPTFLVLIHLGVDVGVLVSFEFLPLGFDGVDWPLCVEVER